jgi:hypothetical protein
MIRMQSSISRNRTQRAGLDASTRRPPALVRATLRPGRHLEWADAIVRRFGRPSIRWGRNPQALVHLRRLRTWRVSVRNVGQSPHVVERRLLERSLFQERRTVLERVVRAVVRSFAPSIDPARVPTPPRPRVRTRAHTRIELRRPEVAITQHTSPARALPVARTPRARAQERWSGAALTRVAKRARMQMDGTSDLPARIVRRLRRREEMPRGARRESLPGRFAGTEPPSDSVVARAPLRPATRRGQTLEPEAAAATRVPAAVNVTQITDEVIRQLDRRFVATRERLGSF